MLTPRPSIVNRQSSIVNCQMIAVLVILAGVVLFFKLGECRTLGSHEAYAVVPAREMLETGDWVVPRFGGVPRLEKPPLCYWVVAASAKLCGKLDEWSARLPAAVSALALAVLMGVWAGRWYGRNAGFAAAMVQMTSVYVIIYARKAEVDMLLCLCTTAAMFLIAGHRPDEPRRRAFVRWIGIYCLLAVSWLAKFHFGPAMVLAPCVVYFVIQRRFRSLLYLANPVGLAIVAAAALIWPYLVLQQVPEAMDVWQGETVGRAVGQLGHQPFWYYAPYVLWLSLPWTPFAIAAVGSSWRRAWKEGNSQERFLWIWFLTQLVIVTVSANKHKHYLNAAMPVLSLLAAQSWVVLVERVRRGKPLVDSRWAIGLTAGCLAAGFVAWSLLTHRWPFLSSEAMGIGTILGFGGSIVVWLLARRRAVAAGWAALLVFSSTHASATAWIVPRQDHRLAAAVFSGDVRSSLAGNRPVCVYRMGTNPIVYYLRTPISRIESEAALAERLERDERLLVVTYASAVPELEELGEARLHTSMVVRPTMAKPKHPPLVAITLWSSIHDCVQSVGRFTFPKGG